MAGNRTNLTYPDGGSASYSYDTANRLSAMTDWMGKNTTFSYDNVGRRTGLNMPNGTKTSYSYDQAGRLTDLAHKTGSGSIIDSFSYAYDPIGNRLSVNMPNEKLAYTYDLLDRLINATPTKLPGTDITMIHKAEDFTYDLVGNRIGGPDAIDNYTYNAGNQLASDRKNQYQYDRNGNLISKTEVGDDGTTKNWTYSYDSENRLIKVIKQEASGTKTITFKYDPFGRRIEKKVEGIEAGIAGTKTYSYVYDNEDIIAEYLTKTENGLSRTETTKYLHGLGIDEPLEVERKGEKYYYHADGLGSITALSDSGQKAMERYSYSSFGDLKRQGDKVKNTYTFTGREWDEEMGLYYYRKRYYEPKVGRFISQDPIGFFGGDTDLYAYVGNNPINGTDPSGLADANTWTYGEISFWAIKSTRDFSSPDGLADAKASIFAACSRGNRCWSVDGATATAPADRAAWNNIVSATGGVDRSGGGNFMCVGTQDCWFVKKCYSCKCGEKTLCQREKNLFPSGTVTVSSTRGGTLYFYNDPLKGWCTTADFNSGCK